MIRHVRHGRPVLPQRSQVGRPQCCRLRPAGGGIEINIPFNPDRLATERDAQLERHGSRSMWLAPLLLGIADARAPAQRIGTPLEKTSYGERGEEPDAVAVAWIGSADFRRVANAAGTDPEWAIRKLAEAGVYTKEKQT